MQGPTIAVVAALISFSVVSQAAGQTFNLPAAPGNLQALEIQGFPAPGEPGALRVTAQPGDQIVLILATAAQTLELLPGFTLEVDPTSVAAIIPAVAPGNGVLTLPYIWPTGVPAGSFAILQALIGSSQGPLLTNAVTLIAQDTPTGPALAAPVVGSIASPTTASIVTVTGTASQSGQSILIQDGSDTVTVTANQGATSNGFSAVITLHPNALNRLFVYALDAAGNQSAPAVVDVVHDQQPPDLAITFPPAGVPLTTATTTVTGTVSDVLSGFIGLDVQINGQPAQVDLGIGTNATFQLSGIPLLTGSPTVLQAAATDAAGNTRTVSITVLSAPPGGDQVAIVSGDGQSDTVGNALAAPVVAQVTDAGGAPLANRLVTFRVVQSDGRLGATSPAAGSGELVVQATSDATGMAQVSWRLGADAGMGNNRLSVTATGVPTVAYACASATAAPPSAIMVGQGNDQVGEAGAALPERFRVWVNDGRNGIPLVPVTFTIITGNGVFPSGGSAVTVLTGPTGHAEAGFVLGLRPGSNFVRADFPGNSGGVATFVATGLKRDPAVGTRFSGVVFSNGSQPIGGATCRLVLPGNPPTTLTTTTDVDGRFDFSAIPTAGAMDLLIDGLTATQVGSQAIVQGTYPSLHYVPILVDGAANSLSGPVFLPELDPANARLYDGTQDVELEIAGVAGLMMLIKAGAMTNPDGSIPSPSNPVLVSLNQVHTDDIPMPIGDGAAPPLAWTLQPSGAHFDPPVEITLPNMAGLPAGAVVNFMSFNHDTGKFEIVAPGHVVPDGSCCVTDPGHGLRVAGWGASPPPPPPTMTIVDCAGEPNGCGPEGGIKVPDSIPGVFDFTTACANHDFCYSTPGVSKTTCETNFLADMIVGCGPTVSLLCAQIAWTYFSAVNSLGGEAFDAAQQAAADCNALAAGPGGPPPPPAPIVQGGPAGPAPQPPPGFVDADGDLLNDSWESANGLDPTDPTDAFADPDNDGLQNFFEYTMLTDPQVFDTDGDGLNDHDEYLNQTLSTGLDQDFEARAGGIEAPVSVIGTYWLANVPKTSDIAFVWFVGTDNGRPVYGQSEYFSTQSSFISVNNVVKSLTPIPSPKKLTLQLGASVLTTIGQTTTVVTSAFMSDGTTEIRNGPLQGTSYTASNPSIASVDANGIVTANGPGTVFITVRNEGVTGVVSAFVSDGMTTTLQGQVVDAQMSVVPGAAVDFGSFVITADPQGMITGTLPVFTGVLVAQVQMMLAGLPVSGQSPQTPVIVGGITDLGIIVVDVDSDGDGLPDWYETQVFGTNPNAIDSDGDGLSDGFEAFVLGTNPALTDSDFDGIDDGIEVSLGTDPAVFNDVTTIIGQVIDSTGSLVTGANVRVLGAPQGHYEATSDSQGSFTIASWPVTLSPLRVVARRPGDMGTSDQHAALPSATTDVGLVTLTAEGPYLFASPRRTGAVTSRAVELADLDADGILDVLIAAPTGFSVALGLGYGTFGPRSLFPMGSGARDLVVSDFNGDGVLDIAVPNESSNDVSVRLGLGGGAFGGVTNFAVGVSPRFMEAGDATGDGVLDLVVAHSGVPEAWVLPGDGSGAFGPATVLPLVSIATALGVGDLDGDGDLDLVIPTNFSFVAPGGGLDSKASVYLNDGTGGFVAAADAIIQGSEKGAVLADIDEDGLLDLVTSSFGSSEVNVSVGNGNGTFGAFVSFPVASFPGMFAVHDIDGDAHLDVVVGGGPDTVTVLFGFGDGNFAPQLQLLAGPVPSDVAVGDLDGDGDQDIVAGNQTAGDLSVLLADAPGQFEPVETYPAGNSPDDAAIADLNGDGRPDAAMANALSSDVSILLADPAGGFLPSVTVAAGAGPSAIVTADLDRDGDLDLAVLNTAGNDVSILENDGLGGFSPGTPVPVNLNSRSLAAGDLDSDGIPDLVVGSNNFGVGVTVHLGSGDRTFIAAPMVVGISRAMDLVLGDLDGDGALDLIVGDSNTTRVFFGNGDGTFGATVSFTGLLGSNSHVALGDVDGDGDLDLLIPRSSSLAFIENTGAGTFGLVQSIPGNTFSPEDVVTGDVNGDGFLDVVTGHDFNHRVVLFLGNGDGTFAPAATYSITGPGRSVAIVDLDGDGDLDIACSVPDGLHVSRNRLIRP